MVKDIRNISKANTQAPKVETLGDMNYTEGGKPPFCNQRASAFRKNTAIEAARAYNEAALKYHGDYARPNDLTS